jgi:hypothetical protein
MNLLPSPDINIMTSLRSAKPPLKFVPEIANYFGNKNKTARFVTIS